MPNSAVITRAVVSALINSSEARGKRRSDTAPRPRESAVRGGSGAEGHAMRGKFNKNAVEGSFAAPLRISSASAGGRGEMGEGRGVRGEESLLVGRGRGGGGGGSGAAGDAPTPQRSGTVLVRPSSQSYSQRFCDSKTGAEVSLRALLRLLTSFSFFRMILFLFWEEARFIYFPEPRNFPTMPGKGCWIGPGCPSGRWVREVQPRLNKERAPGQGNAAQRHPVPPGATQGHPQPRPGHA